MIRIAAVDDEPHVLDRLERMLAGRDDVGLCGRYMEADAMLAGLSMDPVDAVFLDINLPGLSGLELADRILERWPDMAIVFVTAYGEHAVEAFAMQATDYIVKPLTVDRLQKTLQRLKNRPASAPRDRRVTLRCFGRLAVEVDGKPLAFHHTKVRELLAYLASQQGRPVNWDRIADALWPDSPADKAHANFHAASYQLRKLLTEEGIGRLYVSERGNYRLDLAGVHFDRKEFEELSTEIQAPGTSPARKEEAFRSLRILHGAGFLVEEGFDWAIAEERRCRELLKSRSGFVQGR
jgi:two-component SAPR family response regulator